MENKQRSNTNKYLISGVIVLIALLLYLYLSGAFRSESISNSLSKRLLIPETSSLMAATSIQGDLPVLQNPAQLVASNKVTSNNKKNTFEEKFKRQLRGRNNVKLQPIIFDQVFFSAGSKDLNKQALEQVKETAELLNIYQKVNIVIRGHSDNKGSLKKNSVLSLLRSGEMKKALIKEGIDPKRISIEGLGGAEPIASNATKHGRMQNRRIDMIIIDGKKK